MQAVELSGIEGVRWLPDSPCGVGALVLAGSSGRVDSARAELLATTGVLAESIRWFGGPGQHDGPWEIPLELFLARVEDLARQCDRVIVLGTSFGAEAALLVGVHSPHVSSVVAFAPSDVVWAGIRSDGSTTSHWTLGGAPLPFLPFDDTWTQEGGSPAYLGFYEASRRRSSHLVDAASIPVERIDEVVLVAGGDDQVWPSSSMAERLAARRTAHGLATILVTDPDAGHRAILPGEPVVTEGMSLRRGGSEAADRRLGAAAWHALGPLRSTV